MIFRECEHCGATLDPGERCECGGSPQEEKPKTPPNRGVETWRLVNKLAQKIAVLEKENARLTEICRVLDKDCRFCAESRGGKDWTAVCDGCRDNDKWRLIEDERKD